jgi:hypothetical protein
LSANTLPRTPADAGVSDAISYCHVGHEAHDSAGLLCPYWERYDKLPKGPVEGHGIATVEEIVAVNDGDCTWLSRPPTELYIVPS